MGTGVAWLYSVVATVAPGIFPEAFRMGGAVAVYFEAAAVITVLVLVGQVLELRAREQTSGAIRALLDLAPKTARRVGADGSDEEVALDTVAVGDRLRVRPGEKVPVDGVRARRPLVARRIDGHGRIDAGHQRGRRARSSAARSTRPAALVMRADKVGRDTMLAAASSRWSRPHSARARRSSASPTRSPAGSCRRSSSSPCSPSSPGRCSGPSRASPTAWSPRSPC